MSKAQRESAMQTCFLRADMMRALRDWFDAYEGDGSTGRQERALAAACRKYYARGPQFSQGKSEKP